MAMCICMYVHVSLLERMLQGCIMVMCVCMYVHVSLLDLECYRDVLWSCAFLLPPTPSLDAVKFLLLRKYV